MGTIRQVIFLLILSAVSFGLLYPLSRHTTGIQRVAGWFGIEMSSSPIPPIGSLLDPVRGLYLNARHAAALPVTEASIAGLSAPVSIVRDDRDVPHIFAETEWDAIAALGYVTAQDRLFQMDFLQRVAAGRLSEVLGDDLLETDRFLRSTGMLWGAQRNLERIEEEVGEEFKAIERYCAGVNAVLDNLKSEDLPAEFKLLGYAPVRCSTITPLLVLQYMAYDLTFRTDAADYAELESRMNERQYNLLFPEYAHYAPPIVSMEESGSRFEDSESVGRPEARGDESESGTDQAPSGPPDIPSNAATGSWVNPWPSLEGFVHGKGSNNWAVSSIRSTTGAPILSGDMHLALRLPAIWYEAHLVTPDMNVYGVTIPGANGLVEAYNDHLGWTFTNTGADQIDHYRLTLDETRQSYRFEGEWKPIEFAVDTIRVRGRAPVVDTLRFTHWGPIIDWTDEPVSIRWTAHEPSRTMSAVLGMGRSSTLEAFQEALRNWDTPAQNILVATRSGDIAIRSTGFLPIRRSRDGKGLLDGSSNAHEWVGRVPFEALPYAENPVKGFLTSTNQAPVGPWYPYYLGHDWRDVYRSIRIDGLLRSRERHSLADITAYQADVHAVQRDIFAPKLDTLGALEPRSDSLRAWLTRWDGSTAVDRFEPLLMFEFLRVLDSLAWDEFEGVRNPSQESLIYLLREEPESEWLDVRSTDLMRETAGDLLRMALRETVSSVERRYGWDREAWRWGNVHTVRLDHLLATIGPFGRGPYPFPGFAATLSPGGGLSTRHSASWRVVVDFSQTPPQGRGIYPGGQSGNPFSRLYDAHVADYLNFQLYPLRKPRSPDQFADTEVRSRTRLVAHQDGEAQ